MRKTINAKVPFFANLTLELAEKIRDLGVNNRYIVECGYKYITERKGSNEEIIDVQRKLKEMTEANDSLRRRFNDLAISHKELEQKYKEKEENN